MRSPKALELINTIRRDLHDDVGSTLSSIRFLGSMALEDNNRDEHKTQNTLTSNESAKEMLDAMNGIIWSIQPNNDTRENVFVRIVSFSSDLLEVKTIRLRWNISDSML